MAAGAEIKGIPEMQAKFRMIAQKFPGYVGNILYLEMGIELQEVQRRTPVESGDLRDSEKLLGPFFNAGTISVFIVAGGPGIEYAMIVHEDLDAIHKVGQAKYIESVLLESRGFIGARVAKRMNIADLVR